ncbi:hypothetical protein SMACR_03948 [Sordaria macrospora]|uniref:Protection of telomeres protein 1 n=1 Tax=Sordaria macrospora TaxID=5147 RepID=A0A8S8ZW29_SORMA|nr:hypothetical protein SMACR_03948 [Sordaria macrospora]WPJ60315.1 hypothetical protein SMAC4_03948 [Sordaria macrospora]
MMRPLRNRKTAAKAKPPSFPSTFTPLRAILDDDGDAQPGSMVNVIGVLKDCRAPVSTHGSDWKCTLTISDLSIEDEPAGVELVIFRPEARMPEVGAGDVIVVLSAKVQRFKSNPKSLITSKVTSICVYEAAKIPVYPASALVALLPPKQGESHKLLKEEHHQYVSYLYNVIDKYDVPDEAEYQQRVTVSLNVKDKFSLLKDVTDGKFYDLIGQVAKDPYTDEVGRVTLYLSDYTENDLFFHYTWEGVRELASRSFDAYPEDDNNPSEAAGSQQHPWVGPYGKRTIQISCYDSHADFIREAGVGAGTWLSLRNVQVKFGRNGAHLEGFLREERNASSRKINVEILDIVAPHPSITKETVDPRLKEAVRRWCDYSQEKKTQIKAVKAAQEAGAKRKAASISSIGASDDMPLDGQPSPPEKKLTAKERRKLRRAALEKAAEEQEKAALGLNELVTCEVHPKPVLTLATILEPVMYETLVDNQPVKIPLPFTNAKYNACVRVVDFYPRKLEDFACGRKRTEFDILSDNDDDDDDDDDDDNDDDAESDEDNLNSTMDTTDGEDHNNRQSRRTWEWRFALLLEDASTPSSPSPSDTTATAATDMNKKRKRDDPKTARVRLWATVDNTEAQCLTGLDAVNLRRDPRTLATLRERMFTLWGTLEELKAAKARAAKEKEKAEDGNGRKTKRHKGKTTVVQLERLKPPLEDSDGEQQQQQDQEEEEISNKPFSCCLKQYGVRLSEDDDGLPKTDDRPTGGWVRVFGMFGTKICV